VQHAFLFHCILALTIVHDQYLGLGMPIENDVAIAFHWARAAALLNERLSAGPEPGERDALWASAALLGSLAFSSIEATRPEDVWPLNPASNLAWLALTEGKKEIWRIAQPTREDSIFQALLPDYMKYSSPNMASLAELQKLPGSLFQLGGFDNRSLDMSNPYYGPASVLAQTLDIECSKDNVGRFLSLFGCMTMEYKRLLQEKDPCAMLILGYWYAKVCHSQQWYSWQRAYLESQAICEYLIQHFAHDSAILALARDLQTRCAAEKPWRPLSQQQGDVRTLRPLPEQGKANGRNPRRRTGET
jgi:hypothetical protein